MKRTLRYKDENLIAAFLNNFKVTEIAKAAGIAKATVYVYLADPEFQAILTERRRQITEAAIEKMRSKLISNVGIHQKIIDDPETPAQTKVNALQLYYNQLRDWTTTVNLWKQIQALKEQETDGNSQIQTFCGVDDEDFRSYR